MASTAAGWAGAKGSARPPWSATSSADCSASSASGIPPRCPQVLGIDEHFFTRRKGYATTLCDLRNHKIYDVVLGRSELSLEAYFQRLEGKAEVRVVCMDLATIYRSLVRLHFPNARIVADRFHVIRIINHHFLACWRDIDPVGAKNRGLLSLMRRHRHNLKPDQQLRLAAYLAEHPALETIYRFKQRLCYLLLKKHRTRKQCEQLVPRFLRAVYQLRQAGLAQLVQLGQTLYCLVGGNRRHVALHPQQRHHRRLPQQNGAHQPPSLRLPQLPKLQTSREGVMFLESVWDWGLPPLLA